MSIDHLKGSDLHALASVQLQDAKEVNPHSVSSSKILAVKVGKDGTRQLTTINRSDVTCWQLFLRAICLGKLAGLQITLAHVSSYIQSKKHFKEDLKANEQAYHTVCQLASRQLLKKNFWQLWYAVSDMAKLDAAFQLKNIRVLTHVSREGAKWITQDGGECTQLVEVAYNPVCTGIHMLYMMNGQLGRCAYKLLNNTTHFRADVLYRTQAEAQALLQYPHHITVITT